ncbi:unnamed protein product, partial [Ixodes hexagonus]
MPHPFQWRQSSPTGRDLKSRNAGSLKVVGKHYERDQRLSLLKCSALHPKEAYEMMRANFKRELGSRPPEEREAIEKRLPSYGKAFKSFFYRKVRPGGARALRFSDVIQSDYGEDCSLL